MDILERLRAKKGFTNTEIKIADYILENFPKVSAMSARVLAKETFSSNASVLRLCRKIGLSGYRELQVAVLVYLSTRENDGAETESAPRKSAVAEESMAALSGAIQQAAENCRDSIPGGLISRATERILSANRLFVYGADHFDACLFSQWMAALGIAAIVPDSLPENFPLDGPAARGDTALIFSYSETSVQNSRKKIASLRRNGCYVILVSEMTSCPEANLVISLPKGKNESPRTETVYSRTALFFVMACMINIISGNPLPSAPSE